MDTTQVAQQLVDLCRQGKFMEATNALYANDIVSVEPMAMGNMPADTHGIQAVRGKAEWWTNNHEIHDCKVNGPFVHGNQFVVIFDLDVTNKPTGKRMQMSEAGVYTVKDGKVAHEAFFYAPQPR